jgi:phosphatidylglycerol lysyltransferase
MPAIFLQASEAFAAILASHVADVFPCGVETEIHLDRFDLRGGKKAHLRRWVNKAVAEKVRIAEAPIDEVPAEEVLAVSGEWLLRKGGREVRLLARPLCLEREEGVRCFWAWIGDRLVGMVIFDPMYEQQRVTGYYQNFIRMVKNAPHGVSDLATIHAIERFRSEGVFRLSLGLSPLGGIGAAAGARSPVLAWVLTRMHRTSWLYGFQANLFHKRKYDGVERPVYVASSRKSSIRALLGVLKALDVV